MRPRLPCGRGISRRSFVVAGAGLAGLTLTDLLRADSKTLGEVVKSLGQGGYISINDGRKMLGMNTVPEPWADKHWLQQQYFPADERPAPNTSTSSPAADTNDTTNGN